MNRVALSRLVWEEGGAGGTAARTLLLPASGLFRLASRVHHGLYDAGLRRAERPVLPVISVGNLRVGGAGKTPFTRWLVDRLLELGRRPAVLHGGYGSDEPALHRRWHPGVPVFEGRDRAAGVRAAAAAGCDVAVLDDGFQHRRLARDLDVVLLAAEHGADRVRLLPRGPWREPLGALRRADAAVVTRKTASAETAQALAGRIERETGSRPAVAHIRPAGWHALDAVGQDTPPTGPVVAVAATAEPESFFATAELLGVDLATRLPFPDHHVYSETDVERIMRAAAGRVVITPEKDAVKLRTLGERADVRVLEQRITIEEGAARLADGIRKVIE